MAASYLQEVGRDRGSGRHTHKKRWRSGTARKQCSPSSPVVVDAIAAIYQSQRSKSCCSTVPTNFLAWMQSSHPNPQPLQLPLLSRPCQFSRAIMKRQENL